MPMAGSTEDREARTERRVWGICSVDIEHSGRPFGWRRLGKADVHVHHTQASVCWGGGQSGTAKKSPRCGWGLLKLKPPRRGQGHHLLLSPSHQVSTQDKNRQMVGLQESWDEKAKQICQPHVLLSSCLLLPFRVLLPTGEGHGHPV